MKKKFKIIGECSLCGEAIVESRLMTKKEANEKIGSAITLAPIHMPKCEKCGRQPPYKDVNHAYEIKIVEIAD